MPKTTRETIQRFNSRMVQMYPKVLDIESSILFCKLCHRNINGNKVFSVQQHFRTLKHKTALELPSGAFYKTPPPTLALRNHLDAFSLDLCATLLEGNLPLETVDNQSFQMFLVKYTQKDVPNDTTLNLEYIPALYEKYLQNLQQKVKNKPIWISITESLDNEQHLIIKFVIGLIEERQKGTTYLLHMGHMERTSASSFAAFFNDSLQMLWPKKILYENVYLVVTERIPYMIRAINSLKILYPNMIYVNCLLQSFERFLEFVRIHFRKVDAFITNCEAILLKSPHRLHLMRAKYYYLKIPSIKSNRVSESGTWLNAAIYYCDNIKEISNILDMLSQEDNAECILQARKMIQNSSVEAELKYLKENFENVSQAIIQLEKHNDLTLNESLATIELARAGIHATKRLEFINKFEKIMSENYGLQELIAINKSHGASIEPDTMQSKEKSLLYKFAPVVAANMQNMSYARNLLEAKMKKINLKSIKKEKNGIPANDDIENEEHLEVCRKQIGSHTIKNEPSPQKNTLDSTSEFPTIIKSEIDL